MIAACWVAEGKATMRLIRAGALVLFAAAAQVFAQPPMVGFAELGDPAAREFVDPYREMPAERLEDLKTVVRLDDRLVAGKDLAPETRQRLEALRDAARQALVANGYDIEALVAQRWVVAERRQRARVATNPAMEGAEVTLAGYLIPAGVGADGQAMGYLVPQVGMCSHIPAPPPNELVRLRFDPSMSVGSMYVPVRVSGRLQTEASDETIHLLDGMVRMQSLWRLDARTLVAEGPPGPINVAAKPFDPLEPVPPVREASRPSSRTTVLRSSSRSVGISR